MNEATERCYNGAYLREPWMLERLFAMEMKFFHKAMEEGTPADAMPDFIAAHLAGRNHHFMLPSLMLNQIDILEELDSGEDPLTIDVGPAAGEIAQEIIRLLGAFEKIDGSATPAQSL